MVDHIADDSPSPLTPQDRFYTAWATVGELIAMLLTCATAKLLGKRLGLLAEGGWLPGIGDNKTIAALTNKSDRTIDEIVSKQPRPKLKVGNTPFFHLSDFAKESRSK